MIELQTSAAPCAELRAIADSLFVLVWVVLTVVIIKGVIWLATSMGESSWRAAQCESRASKHEPEGESGYGSSFKWVGHEAQEAYREKHWGSYRDLRSAQEALKEYEIRRDERAKNRGQ